MAETIQIKPGEDKELGCQDNILITHFPEGLSINEEVAEQIIRKRLSFSKGIRYAYLVVDHGVVSMNKKAREILSSSEAISGIKATAFVSDNIFSEFLIKFFLSSSTPPPFPVKVCKSIKEAKEWLKNYE